MAVRRTGARVLLRALAAAVLMTAVTTRDARACDKLEPSSCACVTTYVNGLAVTKCPLCAATFWNVWPDGDAGEETCDPALRYRDLRAAAECVLQAGGAGISVHGADASGAHRPYRLDRLQTIHDLPPGGDNLWFSIQGVQDAPVVLDGSGIPGAQPGDAIVELRNVSYVVMTGITCMRTRTSTAGTPRR
jgi:hypothetical protein